MYFFMDTNFYIFEIIKNILHDKILFVSRQSISMKEGGLYSVIF